MSRIILVSGSWRRRDLGVVGVAVGDPDDVQVDVLGEGAQEGQNAFDLGGVGRHVILVDAGREGGRRGDVEGQRTYCARSRPASKVVLVDEGAELVAVAAGLRDCAMAWLTCSRTWARMGSDSARPLS